MVTYKSDSKTVRLAPGENQISITLKKVSSGETKEDTTESTETGDNTGKTDSGGNSGSSETGGADGQGSSGSQGASGDSGSGSTSGGQDSSDGNSDSGTSDSGTSGGSGDTSGGNSGSGGTSGGSSSVGSGSSGDGSSTSGGGSTGGQTSSAGTITLSAPEEKSNTSITVTATITGNENIQQVYCIKGEVEESNIESIFTDNNAFSAAQDSSDTTKWTFTIKAASEDANGTYTVAAKDSSGNIISGAITISNFDFTAPAAIDDSTITGTYDKSASKITLSWTNPEDADFDHVKITYTSTKQGTESTAMDFKVTLKNLNYTQQVNQQVTTQVNQQVIPQVKDKVNVSKQILELCVEPKTKREIATACGYKDIRNFSQNYIAPLMQSRQLKMTIPDKPNSKNQKYITISDNQNNN